MLLNCGVGEDSWESFGLQGDPTSPSWRKSVLNVHWKDWSWSSNTWLSDVKSWLIIKEPGAGKDWRQEEKGTTVQDGWLASLTQWTWVWINSGSWWWTGRPGVLQSMGSQRVRHNWATEQLPLPNSFAWMKAVLPKSQVSWVYFELPTELLLWNTWICLVSKETWIRK